MAERDSIPTDELIELVNSGLVQTRQLSSALTVALEDLVDDHPGDHPVRFTILEERSGS